MKKVFILFFLIFTCSSSAATLKTPESAQIYHGKIYVSNIGNLPPSAKDGDGFIAVLNLNGNFNKILTKELNAPKGITFAKGKLFVTDIDRVLEIDPHSGKVEKIIPIKGSQFLNDITTNGKELFISDTQTNTIYKIPLSTFEPEVFIKSPLLEGPNGLIFKGNTLLCVTWNTGKVLVIKNGKIETLCKVNGNLDGIVVTDKGNVLFSDFKNGIIYKLENNKAIPVFKGLITPADIGYKNGILTVPQFYTNSVKILKVKR
ncbi:ATP/GTP-binding protein [Desulfurobacterium sp. TC5-1]|uniref:ATP/GTP-binding protein n=1 Tax=Desulfurobacterium sp. TC5-1 TaxID=1158318 RepID=UPI0003B55C58|nr:ATP/GTP-binding protein [Desulfurobacterium sp. TC5-1]